ncbi:class I SAM-dependent methyltransferase [Chloroflexota bacterium]
MEKNLVEDSRRIQIMRARDWDRIYRESGDLHFAVLPVVRRATRDFKENNYTKILDLGCGTGKHSIFLARQGFSVYATDISPTGIGIAQKKAESLSLNIRFKQHDMKSIPFTDNFFDAVICTWTLSHGTMDDIRKAVNEIYRVLRSGGMVLTDLPSIATESYGVGKEIEKDTFIGEKDQEEDVPHHYTTREEVIRLFANFCRLRVRLATRRYIDEEGRGHFSKRFYIAAIK